MSTATDPETDEKAGLEDFYKAAPAAKELEDEQAGGDVDEAERDSLFKPEETGRSSLRGWAGKRRKGLIGGGIAGLALGGGFGLFLFFSKPLEFIHFAQIMQQIHFGDVEDFEDNQLTRMYRWMNYRSKPQNRRLSTIGNRMADKLETRFREAGFDVKYDEISGYMERIVIDVDVARSKGVDVQSLASEFGKTIDGPTLDLEISKSPIHFLRNKKLIKASRIAVGQRGLGPWIQMRAVGRRAGFTFHPLKAFDRKTKSLTTDRLREFWRERKNRVRSSGDVNAPTIVTDTSNDDPDVTGDSPDAANELQKEIDSAEVDLSGQKSSSLKKTLKGVGISATTIATAYCIIRDLRGSANDTEYDQIVNGSQRYAMYQNGLGSQVMSGRDFDATQLGFESDALYDKSDDGDAATQPSSWMDSQPIRQSLGLSGGIAPAAYLAYGQTQNVLDRIVGDIPGTALVALNAACSAMGSFFGQIVQFSVDLITGPISTIVQEGVFGVFGDDIFGFASRKLTGEGLPREAAGEALGFIVHEGNFFAADQQFLSMGAKALEPGERKKLIAYLDESRRQDFASQPAFARYFDITDSRSLLGRLAIQTNSSGGGVASVFKAPGFIAASLPAALSRSANAASDYDFGIPKYSFALSERQGLDESHDNPYENANVLISTIDSRSGKSYMQKFSDDDLDNKCFGLQLNPADDALSVASLPRMDSKYPGECANSSDMFFRYRLHIANLMTHYTVDCYEGDVGSCAALGF